MARKFKWQKVVHYYSLLLARYARTNWQFEILRHKLCYIPAGSIENALPDILKQLEKSIERDEEKEWEQEYLQAARARMQKQKVEANHYRKKKPATRQTAKVLQRQEPKKRSKKN